MNQDLEYKRQLRETRKKEAAEKARKTLAKYNTGKNKGQAKKTIGDVKNLAKSSTPWGILSLVMQISPFKDWMYGLALFAAIFKDLLDIIQASGVGYVVAVVLAFCASIFIGLMMLLGSFSTGQSGAKAKLLKKYLVLIGGTGVEILFGLNFLPVETLTALIIYTLVLSERKQAKEVGEKQSSSSQSEGGAPASGAADDYKYDQAA